MVGIPTLDVDMKDFKDEIKKALKENPDWTDQKVADEVGCSRRYVNTIKNER